MGVLSRFSSKPTIAVCKLLVHLIQYRRGTVDKGVSFSGKTFDMHILTDSGWACDVFTRSVCCRWPYCVAVQAIDDSIYVEHAGGVSGDICGEARSGVASEGMEKLRLPFSKPTPFFLDSQSAEDLVKTPLYYKRSKHISFKYHWVREHVDLKSKLRTAQLIHVRTGYL